LDCTYGIVFPRHPSGLYLPLHPLLVRHREGNLAHNVNELLKEAPQFNGGFVTTARFSMSTAMVIRVKELFGILHRPDRGFAPRALHFTSIRKLEMAD
jgi:hypothetical protein